MKIIQVTHVSVTKQSESPLTLLIQASGYVSTSGWTNPRLDSSGDSNPADAVLEFSFEADRPTGPSLQVLTPVFASIVVTPKIAIDAVAVAARLNQISVLAADFGTPPQATTMALGEEGPAPGTEATTFRASTLAIGEETPFPKTWRFGEEHPWPFPGPGPHPFPWPFPTTRALGEEGGPPWTSPAVDDPAPPWGGLTTQAVGEEGGGLPGLPGQPGPWPRGPFGGF